MSDRIAGPLSPIRKRPDGMRRGHIFLAAEPVWAMYAPEPLRFTGWWVAIARTQQGDLTDPITGKLPTLAPPWPADSRLRWSYLWTPPTDDSSTGGGTQWGYLQFLLRRAPATSPPTMQWLGLVYVYETTDGSARGQISPLLGAVWPENLPRIDRRQRLGSTPVSAGSGAFGRSVLDTAACRHRRAGVRLVTVKGVVTLPLLPPSRRS